MTPAFKVDAAVVETTQRIHQQMTSPNTSHLGINWRIVLEINGKPVSEVTRTVDDGIKTAFYHADA